MSQEGRLEENGVSQEEILEENYYFQEEGLGRNTNFPAERQEDVGNIQEYTRYTVRISAVHYVLERLEESALSQEERQEVNRDNREDDDSGPFNNNRLTVASANYLLPRFAEYIYIEDDRPEESEGYQEERREYGPGAAMGEESSTKDQRADKMECTGYNTRYALNTFRECFICLETLYLNGPMSCPVCGCVCCVFCYMRLRNCAACRAPIPFTNWLLPNTVVSQLIDVLMSPCEGHNSTTYPAQRSSRRHTVDDNHQHDMDNDNEGGVRRQYVQYLTPVINHCNCRSCDWIFNTFMFCYGCLGPLQCFGPCVCLACGSMWCLDCNGRWDSCPECRLRFSYLPPAVPCVAVQRMINDFRLPCAYYLFGCTTLLTSETRLNHQRDCPHKPIDRNDGQEVSEGTIRNQHPAQGLVQAQVSSSQRTTDATSSL